MKSDNQEVTLSCIIQKKRAELLFLTMVLEKLKKDYYMLF